MTVEEGAEVFANNCAMCHGDFGEGAGKNPVASGWIWDTYTSSKKWWR